MTGAGAAPATAEIISLADERAAIRRRLLQRSAREVGEKAFARADDYDEDGAYPSADVGALHESGLLTAVLPVKWGGVELSGLPLSEVLSSIGSGSLPLGRLFEGHVNALALVLCYGNHQRIELVAEEARAGKLFGVWNTDDANNLRLIHSQRRYWLPGGASGRNCNGRRNGETLGGAGRIHLGGSVRNERAGAARRLRQSCATCGRGGGP
jgi:alkylation response protein AidB-like acyl-CoA dehydrogenase